MEIRAPMQVSPGVAGPICHNDRTTIRHRTLDPPFRYRPSAVRETRIDLMLKRSEPKIGFQQSAPGRRRMITGHHRMRASRQANGRYLPIDLQEMPGA
jgi:hypothetical protein